jgi:ABC-type Na+ efflux pump permease subunit
MNELLLLTTSELSRRLRSRAFQLGTLAGVLGIAFAILLPFLTERASFSSDRVVLVGPPDLTGPARRLIAKTEDTAAELPAGTPVDEALLKRYKVGEALSLERAPGPQLHVTVYAKDISTLPHRPYGNALVPLNSAIVNGQPTERLSNVSDYPLEVRGVGTKFVNQDASQVAYSIGFTFLFLLYMVIVIQAGAIMSAIVEEKTSRLSEVLVATVNPANLLTGKVVASAVAAILQAAIWLVTAIVTGLFLTRLLASGTGHQAADATSFMRALDALPAFSGGAIFLFFLWFIIGFMQCALLIAGAAALVNRTEDSQSVTIPVLIPFIVAFGVASFALNEPNAGFVTATSFIPMFAPFVMFARSIVGSVPLWQEVLAIAINLVAIWLFAIGGGKLYRTGMISTGTAPSWRQVWAVLRS